MPFYIDIICKINVTQIKHNARKMQARQHQNVIESNVLFWCNYTCVTYVVICFVADRFHVCLTYMANWPAGASSGFRFLSHGRSGKTTPVYWTSVGSTSHKLPLCECHRRAEDTVKARFVGQSPGNLVKRRPNVVLLYIRRRNQFNYAGRNIIYPLLHSLCKSTR